MNVYLRRYFSSRALQYVPIHSPASVADIEKIQDFVNKSNKIFVITGAGVSTESGIPDYRSEGVGLYSKTTYRPMLIQEFISSPNARKRYWARNFVGWPNFSSLHPNKAHFTIKKWQERNLIQCLVTQNVDNLHQKAGSLDAIELHGTGFVVICLHCDYRTDRFCFQNMLTSLNPDFVASGRNSERIRPDGDIHLEQEEITKFNVPHCPNCSGILKPNIVFFGDNVPKDTVNNLYDLLGESDSLLVLGSTMQVFSSYRFALKAKDLGLPIVIISLGKTRADHLARLKITSRVGEILPLITV